jgi:uncharacterized protein (DUF3820 family)
MDKLDDNSIMPYGKYKGRKLADVPADYLLWMYSEGKLFAALEEYVEENMEAIKSNITIRISRKR